MSVAVRVTVTLRAELLEAIDRLEGNRSRFISEAVEHELQRRRREALLQSPANPHPETAELADIGTGDWVKGLSKEHNLVDQSTGTAVRWVEGRGWVQQAR